MRFYVWSVAVFRKFYSVFFVSMEFASFVSFLWSKVLCRGKGVWDYTHGKILIYLPWQKFGCVLVMGFFGLK